MAGGVGDLDQRLVVPREVAGFQHQWQASALVWCDKLQRWVADHKELGDAVLRESPGTYELRFRYADRYSEVRSPTQRRLRLRVNGVVVTHHLDFRPSARRSRYAWRSISTALSAGTNLVQLQVTGNCGPRIDLLYVLPPVPSVVTVAGSGAVGLPSPDDLVVPQTASSTSFAAPQGLALDQTSQLLYIADTWPRFRGLALDTSRGFLYVSDSHHRKVRRIDLGSAPLSGGTITTLSGSGFDVADFEQRLLDPAGLLLDTTANFLYVADTGHGRLRFVDADPNLACPSEVGPPATLQFCGSQSISQVDCLSLGCCFDTVCTSPPNFDGRMTPGFAPEDGGMEQTPPISFVSGGTERCCFPNIRDVLEAPQGLALDSTNRLLYVSQANSHRVVRIHLDQGRCTVAGNDDVGLHFALGAGELLYVAPAAVALLQEHRHLSLLRYGLKFVRALNASEVPVNDLSPVDMDVLKKMVEEILGRDRETTQMALMTEAFALGAAPTVQPAARLISQPVRAAQDAPTRGSLSNSAAGAAAAVVAGAMAARCAGRC
eukprot:s1982_g2.t1